MKYYSFSEKKGKAKIPYVWLVLIFIAAAFYLTKDKVKSWFDPVSVIANVTSSELTSTDGRTNILLLGSDRRTQDSRLGVLTDTILIASIGKLDKDVVLISIPRDLWVKSPDGSFSKINAVYYSGGIESLKTVLNNVLGIPIHYYALVSFDLFKETVDTLGGINVVVDNTFTDYEYPIEGREADTCGKSQSDLDKLFAEGTLPLPTIVPCRYQKVTFTAGPVKLDGETALKYVRSRKGNNNEGTDFARAKRQQKVIMAIKDKVLSVQTLINPLKIKGLYDTYSKNISTDIDFSTIQTFYDLSQQIAFDKVVSIVLDDRSSPENGGLLYAPQDLSLYGGAWVLVPKTGDYTQIHAYVQKYLFSGK